MRCRRMRPVLVLRIRLGNDSRGAKAYFDFAHTALSVVCDQNGKERIIEGGHVRQFSLGKE